jgi:hypothetical protein
MSPSENMVTADERVGGARTAGAVKAWTDSRRARAAIIDDGVAGRSSSQFNN